MSTVNDFFLNCSKVWLAIGTIPDLQELDKRVSSGHKRPPFLHLSFQHPFICPLGSALPPPRLPRCQSHFSTAVETPVEKPGPSGKPMVSKVEEAAVQNRHNWGTNIDPGQDPVGSPIFTQMGCDS